MMFCSSESYSGAAWASVRSSGELEPRELINGRRPTFEGRCVVRYQNPPTSTTTRRRRRNFITSETFPDRRHAHHRESHSSDVIRRRQGGDSTSAQCLFLF